LHPLRLVLEVYRSDDKGRDVKDSRGDIKDGKGRAIIGGRDQQTEVLVSRGSLVQEMIDNILVSYKKQPSAIRLWNYADSHGEQQRQLSPEEHICDVVTTILCICSYPCE
jgi:hypothetical protein